MASIAQTKRQAAQNKLGPLSLGERALLLVSKHPDEVDKTSNYEAVSDNNGLEGALAPLTDVFPDFMDVIAGKRIADYGCGDGFQAAAMARNGARFVQGVEIEANRRAHANALKARCGLANLEFAETISGQFDLITSVNAMEHFIAPSDNLAEMRDALAPCGKIYMTFGPPWLAPYGHHMYFFTDMPWINVLFSEKTVFRIRSLYRNDDVAHYEPGLNRMTIKRFEDEVDKAGLVADFVDYQCVKGGGLLRHIGRLREFAINQVSVILRRA